LKRVAYEVSAESGRRLLAWLDIDSTADRLLRLIRADVVRSITTPRVLGVDDWAKRKGRTYGTILVDLESHKTIDLLAERSASALAAWLVAHPGVEIISRDRGNDYIKGATMGAPNAVQVADRWHLLANLREAVERMMATKPACLRAAGEKAAAPSDILAESRLAEPNWDRQVLGEGKVEGHPAEATTKATAHALARRARKQERFDLVKALHAEGLSDRAIGRRMGMNTTTVRKYLAAESCPLYSTSVHRRRQIDGYLDFLHLRWEAGCHNASQLWREIRQQGFKGKRGMVARWAATERKRSPKRSVNPSSTTPVLGPARVIPWSPRRTAWLLVKDEKALEPGERQALARIQQVDAGVANVHQLVQSFQAMVRRQQPEKLRAWLDNVIATEIEALITFASGIELDFTAVLNALRLPWSSGQTEGQVNRLKFVKRQMFGRASFDLLRRRVLGCPSPDFT
jgi:transposase